MVRLMDESNSLALGERGIMISRLSGSQPDALPLSYVHHSVPRIVPPEGLAPP